MAESGGRRHYLLGRLFSGTRASADAWNNLIAETGRIQLLTVFEWALKANAYSAWNRCFGPLKSTKTVKTDWRQVCSVQ